MARIKMPSKYMEHRLESRYAEHDEDGIKTGETAGHEIVVKVGIGSPRLLLNGRAMTKADAIHLAEMLRGAAALIPSGVSNG